MLAIKALDLALLCFLLPLFLFLLGVLLDVGLELSNPEERVNTTLGTKVKSFLLFRSNNFPLYCLLVIRSSTGRTQAIHIILDIVVAELANL
jgi:hypothetical protein